MAGVHYFSHPLYDGSIMSTYFSCKAKIKYLNREAFDKAIALLVEGGWLKANGLFQGESGGNEVEYEVGGCVAEKSLTIQIPYGYYRNLARFFSADKLFAGAAPNSKAVWTSTDGIFSGGICTNEIGFNEQTVDLTEWWSQQGEDDEEVPDADEDFDEYCAWQSEVEAAFFEEHEW